MSADKKKTYAPHEREYLEEDIDKKDPITVSNIASQEFDYTYNGSDDILKDKRNSNNKH